MAFFVFALLLGFGVFLVIIQIKGEVGTLIFYRTKKGGNWTFFLFLSTIMFAQFALLGGNCGPEKDRLFFADDLSAWSWHLTGGRRMRRLAGDIGCFNYHVFLPVVSDEPHVVVLKVSPQVVWQFFKHLHEQAVHEHLPATDFCRHHSLVQVADNLLTNFFIVLHFSDEG